MNEMCYENVLVAFPYARAMNELTFAPKRLMLDSGAFTAWTKGKSVDITAYSEWVLSIVEQRDNVRAVNLDVIPGEMGRTSSAQERLKGMEQSIINADYLRGQGIEAIEVFHQDEPESFLTDLLQRLPETGVLGISPRNDVDVKSKMKWQRKVLAHIINHVGGPSRMPRTHGLAVTSKQMMRAFPYYSVDSSTWMSVFRYGMFVNENGGMTDTDLVMPHRPNATVPAALDVLTRRSIHNQRHLTDGITTLWESRGVTWTD
jgi:hypothetical protein